MRFMVEFEMEEWDCIDCPFRHDNGFYGGCRLQTDRNGNVYVFSDLDVQLSDCPLDKLMEV